MRFLTLAAFLTSLLCFQACVCDQSAAQQVRKSGGAMVNYKPSDPWKRDRLFNIQTGNSGLFYNCDGEQAKRNSPYICWKMDYEPALPPFVAPWTTWKQQLNQVRQRINDGSCCNLGSRCANCQKAGRNGQQAGCAACVAAASNQPRLSKSNPAQSEVVWSTVQTPPVVDPTHGRKFGLVQGKIVEPRSTKRIEIPVIPPRKSSVATMSLIDQLRSIKKR